MAASTQKTKVLSLRLSIEGMEAVEKAAVDAKTSKSAYAARVLVEAATGKALAPVKPSKPEAIAAVPPPIAKGISLSDPQALEQLRRIGININQIAHAVNGGRYRHASNLAQAVGKLFELLKEPEAFMAHIAQMPPVSIPQTARPTAPEPVKPRAPTTMPPLQLPDPVRATPPAEASVTPTPERRPIPAHVYGEIAAALSQKTQPVVSPAAQMPSAPVPAAPVAATPRRRRYLPPTSSYQRAAARSKQVPTPQPTPPIQAPAAQPEMKVLRRDPPHPQARHQLQDRAPVHSQRPGPAEDGKPGRLGFLSKLWGR
ncbi:MAG: plasmid mobilization relaxosome protein MobC [Betaproteobacteria bacterium]|nr:plasmid mobilization relaxosome protein MobC [Betaproteobacteria bacterium]